MVGYQHIIFPGRFQPISNAHISRIRWIRERYPSSKVTIVIGDMGELSVVNFLTAEERGQIFRMLIKERGWNNVDLVSVQGCADGVEWAHRVKMAVPMADAVASDNPFVLEPLHAAGLFIIKYERSGESCSLIRETPFSDWTKYIPLSEWKVLGNMSIERRMSSLSTGAKYPFMLA